MTAYNPDDERTIFITRFLYRTQAQFEQVGFQFHEQQELPNGRGWRVTLPPGWHKQAVDDDHYEIIDTRWYSRVLIIDDPQHPASIQNGSAYLRPRFLVSHSLAMPEFHERGMFARVWKSTRSGPAIPYETKGVSPKDWESLSYRERQEWEDLLIAQCQAWLDERYPRWRDPTAHWDED